ncbi:MAG: hypothetical protein M1839_006862 [Geoglossum umbratile]|nr:MAG: hypothetical protein M1839_006862 [Geoglossum umbratile]
MTELQPRQPPPPQAREPPPQLQSPSQLQPPSPSPNLTALPPLPPNLTITPITTSHQLSQFRRITTLLLPIRYSPTFYTEILTSPSTALALIATYTPRAPEPGFPIVVGGIRCRLEEEEEEEDDHPADAPPRRRRLYILTLCVLAPYRGLGLATHLLETVVGAVKGMTGEGGAPPPLLADVYAHVWEANEEARRWYCGRGFWEEDGRVEGYYRRLRPQGAVVVRRGGGGEGAGGKERGAEGDEEVD